MNERERWYMLLSKFPRFDIDWPAEVKAAWMRTFHELRQIATAHEARNR